MSEIIKMLDDRLKRIEDNQVCISAQLVDNQRRNDAQFSSLMNNGCAKAEQHTRIENNQSTIFDRLLKVELAQAEGRGRLAIAGAIAGAVLATVFAWIGRHLP